MSTEESLPPSHWSISGFDCSTSEGNQATPLDPAYAGGWSSALRPKILPSPDVLAGNPVANAEDN